MTDYETLADLRRRLETGEETTAGYLGTLRERFEATEPEIEAFLDEADRWGRLETVAAEREARFREDRRPALFGVPVGVKDIFHVDGFETEAGSDVPPEALSGLESAAVTALNEAGAFVLGKTVTTEFAYFEPGPTRNPHDTDHTPGGSSSGSAAAVAAGLCPLALGSQTIGSVNRPAAFCGVVGVKPSYGRIPIGGVMPVAPSVDHVGYFTRDVHDAELAAGVLYDEWRAGFDPETRPTIGAVTGPYLEQASETGRDHFEDHVRRLREAGFDVERLDLFPNIETINRRHNRLVAAETALSHDEWFPAYGDRYAEQTRELIVDGRDLDVGSLADARAGRSSLREAVHEAIEGAAVDVIVSPSAPGPAPEGLESTGDPVMNLPWTHAGLPTVTLPASRTDDGLPIGLQCTARFGADEWLLGWCESLSAALGGSATAA
ncbi:amidase [Natronomonas sp. F2-12]|jgi:Asp-tRNA(Asn)/Glu-tRNA(Gln) amidotransferase A subunit family amidase|uniref:Amidase n=1 Tax=Natronomonas aquatica TaxID=2841590 RepID=A0A9R1D4U4_9EURY|nr:amidase [Natronomonas aquatica]MCQ4333719.1 amidase [Natronomonas aquatica]